MANYAAALSPPSPPPPTADQSTLPVANSAGTDYTYQFNTGAAAVASSSSASTSPSADDHSLSPSIIVTALTLATAVIVSASLYLLLRLISRRFHRGEHHTTHPQSDAVGSLHLRVLQYNNGRDSGSQHHRHQSGSWRVMPEENLSAVNSLPLFTFDSVTAAATGRNSSSIAGDCAVCLSKFEPHDQLRLLPICCHAFHSSCIDAWLPTNQTCPLCRSAIFVSEAEILSKILMTTTSSSSVPDQRSGSFRIEIGSVSGRRIATDAGAGDINRRSYSIGSFDYIIEDALSEIIIGSSRQGLDCGTVVGEKNDVATCTDASTEMVSAPPGSGVANEVGGGGGRSSWLREYVDRLTSAASFSLSSSFRSSGRLFTGSSRRTEFAGSRELDLEASRLGDEIGELFGWLSGV